MSVLFPCWSVFSVVNNCFPASVGSTSSRRRERIQTIKRSFEVIPTGQESAETFARLKSELEIKGTRLDDFDLSIASCALAHNLTLVSNNTKHFQRIPGLRLQNWLS